MKRTAIVTKQSVDWDAYKTSRNRVNIALRRGKSGYYRNKTAQQNKNPKEAYGKQFKNNDLLGRFSSDTTINELSIDGFNITATQEMAIYTVLPRSNLTHAVRSRFVRFAAAVRAVRGYGSCGSRLRFVPFAVTVRAVSGRGSCG